MGKVIELGLLKADDPIFTEGWGVFSRPAFKRPSSGTPKSTDGETQARQRSDSGKQKPEPKPKKGE